MMSVALMLASAGGKVDATAYYSKDEAFELAFGQGATVQMHSLFLSEEQAAAIQQRAKVKLDSYLFTFYEGKRGDSLLGYAAIESHTVRTQPETLLVVLSASGQLARTVILAFHEPPEYQPPERWFDQMTGKPLENLLPGYGIDAISGATLSSRAALDSARKVLAIFELVFQKR